MPGPKDDKFDEAVTTPLSGGAGGGAPGAGSPMDSPTEPRVAADPATLLPLAQRYDLLNELGRGGMGIVYRARDRETGDVVALKVLRSEIVSDRAVVERFKSELLLARKITHPNVCRVHDLNRFGNVAVISMEYIEGDSLRHVLKHFSPLSVRKGLDWAAQICAGIAAAHAQGVVHRDLKPGNMMVGRDGTVKVMDFGLARSLEGGATQTGSLLGTPAYMSPEQVEGKPLDHRTDIYSLGLILYEMFTGTAAFRADTPTATALKRVHEAPRPPREAEPYLPAFLDRAIRKCLEKDPAKRFQSIADLAGALTDKAEPTAPSETRPEDVPLPLHLTHWQRADYYLLGLALAAAAGFFSLVDRVYPYSDMQFRTTREEVTREAQALFKKLDMTATITDVSPYMYSIENYAEQALLLKPSELHYVMQSSGAGVGLHAGFEREGQPGEVWLDVSGKIRVYFLFPGAPDPGEKPLDDQEALPKAVHYAQLVFGEDVSTRPPVEKSRGDNPRRSFLWKLPGPQTGTERRISIGVSRQGLLAASGSFAVTAESPADREREVRQASRRALNAFIWGALGRGLLCLFIIVLFFVRRLYQQTHGALLAIAFGVVAAFFGVAYPYLSPELTRGGWVSIPAGAVVSVFFVYVILCVAEHYLARALPTRLTSWRLLLRKFVKAQPAGLAILRGCAAGMVYLGGHMVVLSLLLLAKWGAPVGPMDLLAFSAFREGAEAPIALLIATGATISAAWWFMAFPAALAARASRRPAVLVAVPALLWLLTVFSLPGVSATPLFSMALIAGLQGLFFSFILYRYDFLTMLVTIFTVEFWAIVYPGFVIFREYDFWKFAPFMPVWFLMLLFGLTTYFLPQVVAGWRRVAAVFE